MQLLNKTKTTIFTCVVDLMLAAGSTVRRGCDMSRLMVYTTVETQTFMQKQYLQKARNVR